MGTVVNIRDVIDKKREADRHVQKGDEEVKNENFKKAEFLYEVALEKYSGFMKPPVSLYERLSDCRLYMKRFTDAVKTLEDCLNRHPDNISVLVKLGMMHIDHWTEIQDPAAAVRYFSRVKELKPEYKSRAMTISAMLAYASSYSKQENHR
ncbi:MAG: tetratricopeptide repeat protein [Candidatus Woesearchaeota archaeon]